MRCRLFFFFHFMKGVGISELHQKNGELRIRLDKVIKDIKYLKETSD